MKRVKVYYGIPYGKHPKGDRRWQRPAEADSVKTDFSQKEEIALQMIRGKDKEGNPARVLSGTTDCLNLDVYTYNGAERKPVLVYIHGGNNQTGSSFEIPGEEIVEREDVVYVAVNYRLGFLGFNCLPSLVNDACSGNFALYDMAAALSWIRTNIKDYGGDPENVTVSGFSAGGRNVMAMLVSPLFRGLFDKAIVYSGGMTMPDEQRCARQTAHLLSSLVIEDGKAEDEEGAVNYLLQESEEVREYLYSLSAERLIRVTQDAGIRMSKFPHLFADGITLPKTGFDRAEYVNDVPVMILTGDTEFSMFGAFDPYLSSLKEYEEAARVFVTKYGSDFYRIFNTQLSAQKMKEDRYRSEVFVVQVNYGGEHSSTSIPMLGAFHGIFVPMLSSDRTFVTFGDFSKSGYCRMADLFREYLKNFLYTGNVNGIGTAVSWNPWTIEEKNTLVLDAEEETGTASAVVKDVFKTNKEIISDMEEDDSLPKDIKETLIRTILNGRWFSDDLDKYFGTPSLWK